MRPSLLFSIAFVSLLLFPRTQMNGCGWFEEPEPYGLFAPDMLADEGLRPFTFSWSAFTDTLDRSAANLADWQSLTGKDLKPEELERVVYTYTLKDLAKLRKESGKDGLKPNQGAPIPGTILSWLIQHPELREPVLDYLVFAKTCEPLAVFDEEHAWEEDKPWREEAVMERLIAEGERLYVAMPNDFLKARVGFQTARMAFYQESFERCIALHDRMVAPLQTPSRLRYWSLANKAGALRRLGRKAEAAVAYAEVFAYCPELRVVCTRGYRIESDEAWQEAVALAKDPEVQATLYLLRALQPYGLPLEEMQQIYKINPKSTMLELLLVREVQKAEEKLPLPGEYRNDFWTAQETAKDEGLIRFVQQAASERKVLNPALWQLACAHLQFIRKEYKAAEASLKKVQEAQLSYQGRLLYRLLNVAVPLGQFNHVGPKEEIRVMETILHPWQASDVHERTIALTRQLMASQYARQGDIAKQRIMENAPLDRAELDVPTLRQIIVFRQRKDLNGFEQWMDAMYTPSMEELHEALGMELLAEARFDEAIPVLEKGTRQTLPTDPFRQHITDCQNCSSNVPQKLLTRLEFAQRMSTLQKQTASPKLAPSAWLMLGHGFYNMSYYGHCWRITRFYRGQSGRETYYAGYEAGNTMLNRFMDCEPARNAYRKAAALSQVDEQKAEALFMAAKCERNLLYNLYYYQDRPAQQQAYQTHFAELQALKRTRFYQEAASECSYLLEFERNSR
ncbi:MAG: hypothetical protein KF690_07625 [Bacteroidetes bacterium]|nr:hypothetical protein [Bacteroidota bacterium]